MSEELLEPHPSLYLADGDIVLSALRSGSTTPYWIFRVDKVYLSRNSPIFADMLSIPQFTGEDPESQTEIPETYDGVPLVRLPDDAEDIAALLTVLYNPMDCV